MAREAPSAKLTSQSTEQPEPSKIHNGRGLELITAGRAPIQNHVARVQRLAQERADTQARRIPWQRLLHTRNQYIDWQEFYLWVRSVLEIENRIPNWLVEELDKRCPGFLESEEKLSPKAAKHRPLPLRLEDWIDDHIFGFAKQEGWFNAITYYAIRDPRYQRAEVCWSECVKTWKKAKPVHYPSFEEWKDMAGRCEDTAHLLPELQKASASVKLATPKRLAEAVPHYVDWEAFAYWVRPGLELGSPLPQEITRELRQRCPGFLEAHPEARDWQQFLSWIGDQNFSHAKSEGWFDAILLFAHRHPRAIRTIEYAEHCEEGWGSQVPDPYPSFEQWRREADSYIESADERL